MTGHAPDSPDTIATPPSALVEPVFYEGGPARGDLIFNLVFGLTLIGIPFAVGAIVRALWLRYRITSRRISVTGGWLGRDRSQISYSQIREVRSVSRGFGAWGDMVLVLTDGAKLEMRSLPRFRETEAYILERMAARRPSGGATGLPPAGSKGFGNPQPVSA
jgi:hypothetical protein